MRPNEFFLVTDLSELRKMMTARRVELGLSQRALARLVGTTQSAICDWETGKVQPRTDNMARWLNALEVDLEILVRYWSVDHF